MSPAIKTLLAVCLAILLLGAGATTWLFLRRGPAGADYVEARVGDLRLAYPAAYARFPPGRNGGRLDSLEIAATFPDLRPAGEATLPLTGVKPGSPALVFLSIGPAERKLDPADLVSMLYSRFLEADVVETDNGLIRRAFQDGSPYDGEDLYFAPPEGRAFAARCAKPTVPPDGLPETCIAALREQGADVEMRFTTALLPQWEKLAEGMRALVKSMMAR
ncbi:MAG: hypothetical protein KGM42_12710 [Hyphomicrobiales bacterium]|nr:hypothetical protein [Hyphomicrobiales bacterium]